ncbi:hypothetical protein C8J56DRAFT_895084 [Mycena floridula]|nr:hypothetical protein C8J56DRAFT_895084 [Mycena floridula]
MKLTPVFASLIMVAGFCSATPSIKQRCGSNATITDQSSFIGHGGHELQVTTVACPDRHQSDLDRSEFTKRATCIPDPTTCSILSCLGSKEPPNFAADCKTLLSSVVAFVLQNQAIFITFNTCMLDFGVGPQTSGICGDKWVDIPASVGVNILSRCPNLSGGEAVCASGLYDIK